MDKVGIEPALLAKFVLACQSPTLLEAAAELGQTPSALGIALRGLEQRLGLQLFIRHGGGLTLRPSAFWLFRSACRLLYLEQHVAEAKRPPDRPLQSLSVELDLAFAIGRFSKALIRATQQLVASEPQLVVAWHFSGEDDGETAHGKSPLPAFVEMKPPADLRIAYGTPHGRLPARAVRLYDDPWIVVTAAGGEVEDASGRDMLYCLTMRPALTEAIAEHARRGGWADRLQQIDADPSELGDVLAQSRRRRLVMPASLLAARMGLARHTHAPLSPPLVSPLLGIPAAGAPQEAQLLLSAMRAALAEEGRIAFHPRLSARQVHYFNLTAQTGGISAAARAANVSQSSMSANLGRMEAALERKLLDRHDDGVSLSAAGAEILPLTTSLEQQHNWIVRKAHDIAAHAEARIAIGMLPSSGHDSALTERLAKVIARIHDLHPSWQLQITESSNAFLHDHVRSGELNLAIVGSVGSQVARIPLGPSEQLCVVCHPSISFGDRREIGLDEACSLPLVLGPRQLSIHQRFAEAARQRQLRLRMEVEVGSLPLAIAIVKRSPFCTILPASAVQFDIERGSLAVVPIRREELAGALWVIFSAERELSEAERSIIQELVATFRPSGGSNVLPWTDG